MSDPAYQALLERISKARKDGKSMAELMQMAGEFLEQQPADYAAGQRNQLLASVRALAQQGTVLQSMMEAAESGDHQVGMKSLLSLYGNLLAAEPPEEREARRAKAEKMMAEAEAEAAEHDAAHQKERLGRGLSKEAGTGKPGRRVVLHEIPKPEMEFDEDVELTLGMVNEAKAKIAREIWEKLPLGHSRIGGLPDLPEGRDWPMHKGKKLPFIAQVNLKEIQRTHPMKLLPKSGHLFAFALISKDDEHWPPPVSVFYHAGPPESLVRSSAPADEEIWPDWGQERVYEMLSAVPAPKDMDDEEAYLAEECVGWLLGEMDEVFGTAGEMADQHMQDGDDWIDLLTVLSVGNMQWSDCGHLYFLIRRSALEKLDFSNMIAGACSS